MEEQHKFNEDSSRNVERPARQEEAAAPDHKFSGEELKSRLMDDPKSIGLDIDGTNPGSRSHPVDYETLDGE
jgi:hypothetical protein